MRALQEILVSKLTPAEVARIVDLVDCVSFEGAGYVDLKLFGAIAAVMERVMYTKFL